MSRFGATDAADCTAALSRAFAGAASLEAAADRVCRTIHEGFVGPDGARACALVRCYTTQPYGALPPDLQRVAKRAFGAVAVSPPEPQMRCLVLLATRGDEPAWNDRRRSVAHQAIPLPSPHIVERAPMIAQLLREFGLDLAHVVRPTAGLVRDRGGSAYGVFHVEDAVGSPYIPAQVGFVDRYGIRSVLGFGGIVASGELLATILFSRVPLPVDVADRFDDVARDLVRALPEGMAVFDGAADA